MADRWAEGESMALPARRRLALSRRAALPAGFLLGGVLVAALALSGSLRDELPPPELERAFDAGFDAGRAEANAEAFRRGVDQRAAESDAYFRGLADRLMAQTQARVPAFAVSPGQSSPVPISAEAGAAWEGSCGPNAPAWVAALRGAEACAAERQP